MKFVRYMAALALAAAVALAGCADASYDNSPNGPLELSHSSVTVGKEAQSVTIGITARDAGWTLTGPEAWCAASPAQGERGVTRATITFEAYETDSDSETGEAPARTATFTFTSGTTTKTITVTQQPVTLGPVAHKDRELNQAVHAELQSWYFNGEAREESVVANYDQPWDDFYFNFVSKDLKRNEDFEGRLWSTTYPESKFPQRYTYSYIDRRPTSDPEAPLNYGMEFELNQDYGNRRLAARILYVEPGSPAAKAGLQRGTWFDTVNGTQLGDWQTDEGDFGWHYNRFIDTLVHPIAGISPTITTRGFSASGLNFTTDTRQVTLTPEHRAPVALLGKQTFSVDVLSSDGSDPVSLNVGYLMWNNFDAAHEAELTSTFASDFTGRDLDAFILDVRYNKHGTARMANLMANLLVGNSQGVAGKTFARYEYDKGSPAVLKNETALFEAHEHGIGVDTVFVLVSRHTAGAAELLINALRGVEAEEDTNLRLVVVGETTAGLSVGMVERPIDYPADADWRYTARMLAFRCYNGSGKGDYNWGFVPNAPVSEWARNQETIAWSTDWRWKGTVGSTEDPLIRESVYMLNRRKVLPTGRVGVASKANRTGFPREFCFPTALLAE